MRFQGSRRAGGTKPRLSFLLWGLGFLFAFPAAPLRAQDGGGADAPATEGSSAQIDSATRKLMAAHGLFQRGLFKLAAQGYDEFLSEHANHTESATARCCAPWSNA